MRHITNDLSAEQRQALGDFDATAAQLAADAVPQPTPEQTLKLIEQLRPLAPAQATLRSDRSPPALNLNTWLWLARSQALLLDAGFWWACAGVMLLGLLVGALGGGGTLALGFVLLAPLLAAVCVIYAFWPATHTLWELERASPTQPLQLLYARLGLVLVCNSVLAGVLLLMIEMHEPRLTLWRLLLLWLGPMLLLVGAALYTSVRWGNLAGIAAPLCIWAGSVTVGWQALVRPRMAETDELLTWALPLLNTSNALLYGSLVALAGGMLLLLQSGRAAVAVAR